jgi:hypothetical protein
MGFDEDQFTAEQCLSALACAGRGSIAASAGALSVTCPAQYLVHDGQLLVIADASAAVPYPDGMTAALLADGCDEVGGMRWIVLIVGPIRRIDTACSASAVSGQQHVFHLQPEILSGRWLD